MPPPPLAISPQDIRAAHARIADQLDATPCLHSRTLSQLTGAQIYIKFENLQFTASFKERGALNRLLQLSAGERRHGVCTMSAGNHGQAVAYHVPIGGGALIAGVAAAAGGLAAAAAGGAPIEIVGVQTLSYPSMPAALRGEQGGNILDVFHRRLSLEVPAKSATLELSFEARDAPHAGAIIAAIRAAGFDASER